MGVKNGFVGKKIKLNGNWLIFIWGYYVRIIWKINKKVINFRVMFRV